MARAIIISGLLVNFSDNFEQFLKDLDEEVDTYVHTWNTFENLRWVHKLMRYQNKTKIVINIEEPLEVPKKYSILYSTYKAANLIPDLSKYETVIKFKPDLDTNQINYSKDISKYFEEAYIHTRPLLEGKTKEDFIYGRVLYKTLDERMFTLYPEGVEKLFKRPFEDFDKDITTLDIYLQKKYIKEYEGSILWTNYIKERGLDLIQDLTLKIPNCKQTSY